MHISGWDSLWPCRYSVQQGHLLNLDLWVEPGLVRVLGEQLYVDFRGAMASCFSSAFLIKVKHSWFALTLASMMRRVRVGDGAIKHKVFKESLGDDRSLKNPRPHLVGRLKVLLVKTLSFPVVEVCYKPSYQILSESGPERIMSIRTWRETVSNFFEMSTAMAIVLLEGALLVKARDYPSIN